MFSLLHKLVFKLVNSPEKQFKTPTVAAEQKLESVSPSIIVLPSEPYSVTKKLMT